MFRNSLASIGIAFVVLLLLIGSLTGLGFYQLSQVQAAFERVVEDNNSKAQHVTDIQALGYQRTNSLYNMLLERDAFKRDIHYLEYNRIGFLIGQTRQQFATRALSDAEQAIYEKQSALIRDVVVLQDGIVDLLSAERFQLALDSYVNHAIPLQNRINQSFHDLRALQHRASAQTLQQAQQAADQALYVALSLGLSSLLLGAWVAARVMRKVGQQSDQLAHHLEQVEIARDKAEQANQAKSDFLAVVSHEIRTPMNGVLGMVQLLANTPLSDEQKDYLHTMECSGEGLLALLNDLLDLSKIEANHLTLEQVDFDLQQLVEGTLLMFSSLAQEKNIALRADLDPQLPKAFQGDPNRLRQVLFNLVSNAIKFTQHGFVAVQVRVLGEAEEGASQIELAVLDSGIGVDEKAKVRLFDPFVQADTSIARRFGGTGLGLSISQRLVNAMGGSLQVESELGQGSRFHFAIELQQGQLHADVEALAEEPIEQLKVMVVDDDVVNRKVAVGLLVAEGHQVATVTSGQQAITLAAAERFDVILMDLRMPDMDGCEATRQLHEDAVSSSVPPIVGVTADLSGAAQRLCLEAGMDAVIGKPLRKHELRTCLRQYSPGHPGAMNGSSVDGNQTPLVDEVAVDNLIETLGAESFAELVDLFRDSSLEVIDGLFEAYGHGDVATLTLLAHRLRGSARSLGLMRLSEQSAAMEDALEKQARLPNEEQLKQLAALRDRSAQLLEQRYGGFTIRQVS